MDIHNSIFGYPILVIELWISLNQLILILKCVLGYPKISLNLGYP